MSDTTDESNPSGEKEPNWRDKLEASIARAKELEDKLAERDRKDAFNAAGLDLSLNEDGKPKNPGHAFFAQHYSDKLDPEAIKASASEIGVLAAGPQVNETQQLANEHASLDQLSRNAPSVAPVGNEAQVLEQLTKFDIDHARDDNAFWNVAQAAGWTKQG